MPHTQDLNNDEWDNPQEFEGVQLPKWPTDAFPGLALRYVQEVSRASETPIELAAMLFLSALATVSQKNYEVQVNESYNEPLCLWILAILPPASRKSSVFGQIMRPIQIWEEQRKDTLKIDIDALLSKQKTLEEKIKYLRKRAAKMEDEELDKLQSQILLLENEINATLAYPRLWTSDITPEHLGTVMAQNDEAMAILSDEGAIFDILGGLYSKGKSNIDLFLKGHSAGSVRVDRQSKSPIFLKKALLSIGLTVQPEVMKDICKNKTFRGRGLLGRFLYVIPPSNIGHRTLEEKPMEETIKNHYSASIASILNHQKDITTNSQYVLKLEPEAYLKWLEYSKNLELMMGPEIDYLSHITDWAGKLSGQIMRIAALLHIYEYAFEKPWEKKISLNVMRGAVKIGHALTKHALKVFGLIYEEDGVLVAKDILDWINQLSLERFSHRECLRRFRKYQKKPLQPGLKILEERGYIHPVTYQPKKGAPSLIYEVNPHCKNIYKGQ